MLNSSCIHSKSKGKGKTWTQNQDFISAGLAFGLASSPCTTPVLAVLLAWVAKEGNPLSGIIFLGSFAIGQIVPLFLAGTFAASIPKLLSLRPIGKWVPPIRGVILLTIGLMSLLSIWI